MRYCALLRGINVGKTKRLEMKKLKALFQSLSYADVTTYINSGNVSFTSTKQPTALRQEIERALQREFGLEIPTLIKTRPEMRRIAKAIPEDWKNDTEHRTDVAYLFDEADSKHLLEDLPVRREFLDIRYVTGALIWHVRRKDYNKSHLNQLIRHPAYPFMTIRNVNTARHFAESV